MKNINILLTSVGRRTYLVEYFKDAVGNGGKVYTSNSIMTYAMRQSDGFVISPQIYDEGYVDFLIQYCLKYDISMIISCFDIDLPVLAANRGKFTLNNIQLIVSDLEVTHICSDKWKTFQFLKKNKISCPKTFIEVSDFRKSLAVGEINYPVIIKPRWGMGSIGIYKIYNSEEFDILYRRLQSEIFNTYLKFESDEDRGHCIVIQEVIDGQEYGLDIFNDLKGNLVTIIAKKKIAMRAGETDIAEIVDNKQFWDYGILISKKLHHIANLDVDCFVDEKGKVYILEMNCRFGGQYPFSHLAGVDFPRQIVEWVKGNETKEELITPCIGTIGFKDLSPVIIQ